VQAEPWLVEQENEVSILFHLPLTESNQTMKLKNQMKPLLR